MVAVGFGDRWAGLDEGPGLGEEGQGVDDGWWTWGIEGVFIADPRA
jgi:hypothetical protein